MRKTGCYLDYPLFVPALLHGDMSGRDLRVGMAQSKLPTSTPTPGVDLTQRRFGYHVLIPAFKVLNPLPDIL